MFPERFEHGGRRPRIQVACGLVGEEDVRLTHECPAQRNTLSLSSRDLTRLAIGWDGDVEPVHELASPPCGLTPRLVPVQGRFDDVVQHATGGIECGILKHEPKPPGSQARTSGIGEVVHPLTVYLDNASRQFDHEPQQVQAGGLSAA